MKKKYRKHLYYIEEIISEGCGGHYDSCSCDEKEGDILYFKHHSTKCWCGYKTEKQTEELAQKRRQFTWKAGTYLKNRFLKDLTPVCFAFYGRTHGFLAGYAHSCKEEELKFVPIGYPGTLNTGNGDSLGDLRGVPDILNFEEAHRYFKIGRELFDYLMRFKTDNYDNFRYTDLPKKDREPIKEQVSNLNLRNIQYLIDTIRGHRYELINNNPR